LLDEPDNFLDVDGKRWLEEMMNDSPKTILYVSHDRELLARTSHRVVTLEANGVWVHPGSFAGYHDARDRRLDKIDEEHRRFKEERDRLVAAMREFKRRAALNDKFATKARSMEKRIERFEVDQAPRERVSEQDIKMRLRGGRTGKIAFRAKGLSLRDIVKPFDAEIWYGERIGVLGPNGTGKSHLLKLLAGEAIEHAGEWKLGARVRPDLFSQLHDRPDLGALPIIDLLRKRGIEMGKAMSALRRYELHGAATNSFGVLSGGQQARFQILLMEVDNPTMLLLDEPTDNLDVDSAEALEYGLAGYEGTVIAVTHDRWFMRLLDRFLFFHADGRVEELLESPYLAA
jgi:ATPase subunit of ABC transporter with duplicated ATPase domains